MSPLRLSYDDWASTCDDGGPPTYSVFDTVSGRTLFRTRSLSVARILAARPYAGLDYEEVSNNA